jgi:hypothetical protein
MPPAAGPAAGPILRIVEYMPIDRPRLSCADTLVSIARIAGTITPTMMPCRARTTSNCSNVLTSAHATASTANPANPASTNGFRLSSLSESRPITGYDAAAKIPKTLKTRADLIARLVTVTAGRTRMYSGINTISIPVPNSTKSAEIAMLHSSVRVQRFFIRSAPHIKRALTHGISRSHEPFDCLYHTRL